MYRASKYNLSQASLEFWAKKFNECPNHKNLKWLYIEEESFDNDGLIAEI